MSKWPNPKTTVSIVFAFSLRTPTALSFVPKQIFPLTRATFFMFYIDFPVREPKHLDSRRHIIWDLGNLEISYIGLDQIIELVETFKIVPIFFEYFWIFLNKIVFEMVFWNSPKSATRCKDMLYIFWIVTSYCIFWNLNLRLGELGKNGVTAKTDQKWDFTWVKIA